MTTILSRFPLDKYANVVMSDLERAYHDYRNNDVLIAQLNDELAQFGWRYIPGEQPERLPANYQPLFRARRIFIQIPALTGTPED